ncbi:hypothetical protein, partial [Cohnella xylanilytica]|uniref:hypothetical protein n=1 Tax=Cohnella xylanilytica TaxID=557555 RepID=UPI001C86EF89
LLFTLHSSKAPFSRRVCMIFRTIQAIQAIQAAQAKAPSLEADGSESKSNGTVPLGNGHPLFFGPLGSAKMAIHKKRKAANHATI